MNTTETTHNQQQAKPAPICGIYQIRCRVNGYRYIGQSTHIGNRIEEHVMGDRNGSGLVYHNHPNKGLQVDFDRYGAKAFDVTIVQICKPDELNKLEAYWIKKRGEYNISPSKDDVKVPFLVGGWAIDRPLCNLADIAPPPQKKRKVAQISALFEFALIGLAATTGCELASMANIPKVQGGVALGAVTMLCRWKQYQ